MGIKRVYKKIKEAKTEELSILDAFENNPKTKSRYIKESATPRWEVYNKVLSIIEDECPEVKEDE